MGTLVMERHFSAAPITVFAFITKTENLLEWWGPEGTTIPEHNLSFAAPGPWSATMIGPQGHGATVGGQVLSIDPPKHVELTLSFVEPSGEQGPESTIRFDLANDGASGTHFTLTQTGLDPEHIEDMKNKGWTSALGRLEQLITKTKEG